MTKTIIDRVGSRGEHIGDVVASGDSEGTILVVDDQAMSRETLEALLGDNGFKTIGAASGYEAIEIASSTQLDVILLDIGLPDLSGLEVCKILRQSDATKNTPVLFLSGHNDTFTIVKGFQVGGTDYIRKPYHPGEVLARVRANVELSRMRAHMDSINDHLENKVSKKSLQLRDEAKRHRHTTDILHDFIVYDRVTGLASRESLISQLEKFVVSSTSGENSECMIIHLDCVGFANVNLSLGFDSGDEVLGEIASRLRELRQNFDVISRLTSDEFVLILFGKVRREVALEITSEIRELLSKPYQIGSHEIRLNFNFGITIGSAKGRSSRALLNEADNALRQSKAHVLNWRTFYRTEMSLEAKKRLSLESEVRRAIELNELEFFYQPLIDLENDRVSSVEALVRWNHPVRGIVTPDKFLFIIEELGLTRALDELVIHEAASQVGRLDCDASTAGIAVSINLFAQELEYRVIVDRLLSIVESSNVDPSRIRLEITEGAFIHNMTKASRVVSALREIGFVVVMDDFGAGYSSLNQLRSISFDAIKLDRVFMQQLENNGYNSSVSFIRKVIELCHTKTNEVVAEGIETEFQNLIARSLNCSHGQGFLFGRPMPAAQLVSFIHRGEVAPAAPVADIEQILAI